MRFATTASRVRRTCALAAAIFVVVAASVAASVVIAPGTAHAEGGLEITSTTSYQVRPAEGVVNVVVTATYKNVLSNDGGSAKNIYFSGSYLPLPVGAVNPTLTSDGKPLDSTRKPGQGAGVELMEFDFTGNLNYGQQTAVELRYALPGGAPRDDKNLSRINPGYVGFEASAIGDPGRTVLEIELPLDFVLDKTSSLNGAPAVDGPTSRTFRLGGDALNGAGNADGLQWAWVSATNIKMLASSTAKISGVDVQFLAWPNDPEWTAYANSTVNDSVPYLEKKLGSKWPATSTRVRESGAPFIYRLPGWFDQGGDIELGENLDRRVVVHQLSHAWFASPPFAERWMIEGLAQHVSAVGVADLYGQDVKPPDPNRFKPPLRAWTYKSRGDRAVEAAGYNESWYTLNAIFAVAGDDKLPRLIASANDNLNREKPLLDHQILLNVTEPATGDNVTTSTEVSTILAEHVLGKPAIAELKVRNSTREGRGALVGAAGKWGVPKAVDQSINNWNFKRADQLIGWATGTLKVRNDLTDKARRARLDVGTEPLQKQYQAATNKAQFAQVDSEAKALSESIDNVTEARAAMGATGGVWYSVGSWFGDSPDDHLASAEQALADGNSEKADTESSQAVSTIEATPRRGQIRLGAAIAIVVVVALGLFAFLRRRSRRKADEDAAARAEPPPPPDPTPVGSFVGAAASTRPPAPTLDGSVDTLADDPPPSSSSPSGVGFEGFRPVARPEPPEVPVVRPEPPDTRPDPPDPRPDPPEMRPDPPKIQLVPPELLDSASGLDPTSPDQEHAASHEVTPDVEGNAAD